MLCVAALGAEFVGSANPLARNGFEIDYVTGEGASRWVPLAEAWPVPFEHGMPVAPVHFPEGSAAHEWAVVVGDHGWARGV